MDEDKEDEIFNEMVFEPYDTRAEIINMCCASINAVDNFDIGMIEKENRRRINEIKTMSLRLIHHHISMLYDESFED